jgi:predicted Rossmann-fold nucleotide-binding protein
VAGYWGPLVAALDRMVEAGFLRAQHRELLVVADDPDDLLARLESWRPRSVDKWIGRGEA